MIETEDYKAVYDCDNSTVRFDFTFQITQESDLDVKRYDSVGLVEGTLLLGTDYTMEQATVGTWLDGGTVVTTTAYITNDRISLTRDVDSTQVLDYKENDPFPAESHEGGLDKLTIISQQLEELLSRAMLIPKSDPVSIDMELGPKETRLSRFIQFHATTGEPTLVTPYSPGTLSVTAYIETLLDDANATEALATLGLVVTAFAKTILDDADAPAVRTTLGEWDLIVDSVADLELLAAGDSTTYSRVLIKQGTYSTALLLDFDAHDVEYLRGETRDTQITMTNAAASGNLITLRDDGVYESFVVEHTGAINQTAVNIISAVTANNNIICRDIKVLGSGDGDGDGVGFNNIARSSNDLAHNGGLFNCFSQDNFKGFMECYKIADCFAYSNAGRGFDDCHQLSHCRSISNESGFVDCDIITCSIALSNTTVGFSSTDHISSCDADNNTTDGFSLCDGVSSCRSVNNGDDGFATCKRLSSCFATTNTGYDYNGCTYLSSCEATGTGASYWNANTEVDGDSCNNV